MASVQISRSCTVQCMQIVWRADAVPQHREKHWRHPGNMIRGDSTRTSPIPQSSTSFSLDLRQTSKLLLYCDKDEHTTVSVSLDSTSSLIGDRGSIAGRPAEAALIASNHLTYPRNLSGALVFHRWLRISATVPCAMVSPRCALLVHLESLES